MSDVVYLDHAASTPVRDEAIDAMLPLLRDCYGNPSGAHKMARDARRRIDDARDVIAAGIGCEPGEVVFTAGGTEADNLAVFGTHASMGGTVVCPATEHHAVLHPVERLDGRVLGVDARGRVRLDELEAALDEDTALVSVMLVNNETGVIQSLDPVADLIAEKAPRALLHTDAVQGFPWLDLVPLVARADLISIASHKFGGPKGVGALIVREGTTLVPQILGGGQERGVRSGTHNAAGIVGMAAAAAATMADRAAVNERVRDLRDRLVDGLVQQVEDTVETALGADASSPEARGHKTPGICHVCFDGIESEALLFLLEREDILASAASSCSSGAQDPSHVLAAMGFSRGLAAGSLRLSLGYNTTDADVDRALSVVPGAVEHLRRTGS